MIEPDLKITRNKSHDSLRLLAALLVVFAHIRAFFILPIENISRPSMIEGIFYFFTSMGHQAVMVFFVLSGYYVGGSALRRGDFSPRTFKFFLIARIVRLWLVLIPVMIVSALLILPLCGEKKTTCSDIRIVSLNSDFVFSLSWDTFIGNIFFLQGFKAQFFGGNAPLWSLSYEFWLYLIFFALGGFFFKSRSWFTPIFAVTIIITITFLGMSVNWLIWFLVWISGAISSFLQVKVHSSIRISSFSLCFLTLVLASATKFMGPNWREDQYSLIGDLFLGISFAFVLTIFSEKQKKDTRMKSYSFPDFSYSLYALHFILILFLYLLARSKGFEISYSLKLESVLYFAALLNLIVLICYFFSLVTERYTYAVRKQISRLLA